MPEQRSPYIAIVLFVLLLAPVAGFASEPPQFVVQLTRSADNFGHRRALLQIDKVLDDLGENNVAFTVVAYEYGITALLANNPQTSQLVTKLATRGVKFKACRISMRASDINEDDIAIEADFVPAGAPEVIRLQLQGYKYWRP